MNSRLKSEIENYLHDNYQNNGYVKGHTPRFLKTIELIGDIQGETFLDVGETDVISHILLSFLKVGELHVTNYSERYAAVKICDGIKTYVRHNMDLEKHWFALPSEYFDTILVGEVIEHFEIDPMYAFFEFNRVQKYGSRLIITTPNSCSMNNVNKMLAGYRPHFFMQYSRSGALGRHNFEHDVHSVCLLVENAGYEIESLGTWDVFEARNDAAALHLENNIAFNKEFRGDDIFCVARKVSEPRMRYPDQIYD